MQIVHHVVRPIFSLVLGLPVVVLALENTSTELIFCPQIVGEIGYINGKTREHVAPPKTKDDFSKRKKQLRSPNRDIRATAIDALAMVGDIDLLRDLIKSGNENDLHRYVINYRNNDGTVCLHPKVEAIISENLSRRTTGKILMRIFGKNLYQSPAIVEQLLTMTPGMQEYERHYANIINAVTATNQPGNADGVLRHAIMYIAYYEAKYSRLPQSTDLKPYLDYFDNHKYLKAADYFQSLVSRTNVDNMKYTPRFNFMELRLQVYGQAEKYPTSTARKFLLGEGVRLSNTNWGTQRRDTNLSIHTHEISSLYKSLLANNRDGSINTEILAHVKNILTNTRRLSNGVHTIRYDSYKVIAEIGTAEAYNQLIAELAALNRIPGVNSYDLSLILELAAKMADRTKVDISALLANNPFPDDLTNSKTIVDMLEKHPHPEGRPYLVGMLGKLDSPGYSASNRAYHFDRFIDVLSAYDGKRPLAQTKRGIKRLYKTGKLTKKEFDSLDHPLSKEEIAVIEANRSSLRDVRRVFHYLKLPTDTGTVALKTSGNSSRLNGYYQLANNQNYYLITHRQGNDTGYYSMIHRNSGKSFKICGKPIISPDNKRLMCTQIDLELGDQGNYIEVFRLVDSGLESEWHHSYKPETRTGPANAKWVGNNSILFEELYYKKIKSWKSVGFDDNW